MSGLGGAGCASWPPVCCDTYTARRSFDGGGGGDCDDDDDMLVGAGHGEEVPTGRNERPPVRRYGGVASLETT